jgi:MFS family permease
MTQGQTDTTTDRPATLIAATVFFTLLCYISIGLPLAVIPSLVHLGLGFDVVVAGLAVSLQYLATFLTRGWTGRIIDGVGAKRSVTVGLALVCGSGALLSLSGALAGVPLLSLALLLASRMLLGAGESCTGTGCIAWAIGLTSVGRTAQVISYNGIACYGGIALGAPLGLAIAGGSSAHGILRTGQVTMVLTLFGLALVSRRTGVPAAGGGPRASYRRILGTVAPYGAGLALGSIGFGVIATFITLFYDQHGWNHPGQPQGLFGAGVALSVFGIAFVVTRLLLADQIARRGGIPVAFVSLVVEALGLLLLWQAPAAWLAVLGCALTGAGFALLFPALGVLAVARAGAQNRGSAIGAYSVFLDISLGLSGPVLGLIAKGYGYASLFLCAGLACVAGLLVCVALRRLVDLPSYG